MTKETIEQIFEYSYNPIIFFCTTDQYLNNDWVESNFNNIKYEFIFCHNFEEIILLLKSISFCVDINPKNVEYWSKYVNNVILVNTENNLDIKVSEGILRVNEFKTIYEIYWKSLINCQDKI